MIDPERAAATIRAQIPAEAVRHGWNVSGLSFDTDDASERWSIGLIGPVEAETEIVRFLGGPQRALLMVHTGSHGRLTAPTLDDLARLVGEWLAAVGSWVR